MIREAPLPDPRQGSLLTNPPAELRETVVRHGMQIIAFSAHFADLMTGTHPPLRNARTNDYVDRAAEQVAKSLVNGFLCFRGIFERVCVRINQFYLLQLYKRLTVHFLKNLSDLIILS